MIGLILMDSIFSPIRKVNFTVDDTRVGQSVDLDWLHARDRDQRFDHAWTMRFSEAANIFTRISSPVHRLLDRREA